MLKNERGGIFAKIVLVLFLICILIIVGGIIWYKVSIEPVQKESEKVIVEIEYGSGISGVAEKLERSGVIKDANAFKIYCKINNRTLIKAGKYEFDKNMTLDKILTMVENEEIVDETVTITFPEGKNMTWIAATIAENTSNSQEDVYNLLKNEEYIDELIDKYWFITEDIKDEDIYYCLEGYLYPDTYIFTDENVTVKGIFEKMLDKMNSVLTPYKEEIDDSEYSIHEILTLASVVELEAKNEEDRAGVAGVFINRLDRNMALQSDVTTYYGLQIAMDERDLTAKELNENNGYNTRATSMAGKLPVGPICMVSESSIKAVLNPEETNNLYFVADKNGKVYFSETNAEHEEKIQELKDEDLWYTYD